MSLRYLGNGPEAARGRGWLMGERIRFKCTRCGYLMSGDPSETDTCTCGRLHKDADAGRFGSVDGDEAIEVYEVVD